MLKINNKILALVILILFTTAAFSCKNSQSAQDVEESVVLDIGDVTLSIGDELVITPTFTAGVTTQREFRWSTSHPDVVSITAKDDYSGLITANRSGESTITFYSSDLELSDSIEVTVVRSENDGVLRVLAIGNSFSEDALEDYLYDLAAAENVPMVIGNLYIGGSSLELHWNNAQTNYPAYDYRKITQDGNKTNTPGTTIETAVADENWDYISFQQVSSHSGKFETFEASLPYLIDYVKQLNNDPEVQYILHQTWAYSKTSSHSAFPDYGNDQVVMYESIVDAVRKAQISFDLDYVIPAGTAIQNGRNTLIGDNFTRDGYHLNYGIGRYTAASTWFEALSGINVVGNSFRPETLNDLETEIAQHSAHAALLDPDRVTILSDYQGGDTVPLLDPIYINFGRNTVPGWNTLSDHHEGASINNLKDENDEFTNISMEVTERFNAMNTVGENATATDFNMTADVSSQSYYGNSRGTWQGLEIRQSQIIFSELDENSTYNLCFFSSRANVNDNRETKFIVSGENSDTVNLQASNNTSETVCANGIQPDSAEKISVTITAGDNNNNGSGFYYINAMRLAPGE